METLEQIYNKHKKGDWPDKNSTHSYISVYEEVLAPYRHTAKNVLEIGLMSGESLRMWDEYFTGTVYGIDCDIKPIGGKADLTQAIQDGLNILIGDATKGFVIEEYYGGMKFDVIIEDANHDIIQQVDIYNVLHKYLKKGGIYIIEDIQNIDGHRSVFEFITEATKSSIEIIDLRHIKNRYDDVLVIIRK